MLGQAKKNLTPTTSGVGKRAGNWGSRGNWCSLRFFFTNKIQKLYAVGCQDLANGQQHEKGTGTGAAGEWERRIAAACDSHSLEDSVRGRH